jgi:hypothetical protein
MNQIEALRRLERLDVPGFETRDAAALLEVAAANAHVILRRLAEKGFLVHVARGHWMPKRRAHRFAVPEFLSAPSPAYVSLQSALFHHGLIEQIPAVVYAVTLAKSHRATTPLATISFHHLPPTLFTGFDVDRSGDFKMAEPEKALFDLFYLSQSRIRLFAALPELEFPRGFRWKVLRGYASLVPPGARRAAVLNRIEAVARQRGSGSGASRR